MDKFFKKVYTRLIEIEQKRPWLLAQAGIKPSTWSSWEKHGRFPPADRAVAIAETLGVTVEYLVTGRETPMDLRDYSPTHANILTQLQEMDEDQLRRVLATVYAISIEEATGDR